MKSISGPRAYLAREWTNGMGTGGPALAPQPGARGRHWDYLDRNHEALSGNRRMQLSVRNLERIDDGELAEIRRRGAGHRRRFTA